MKQIFSFFTFATPFVWRVTMVFIGILLIWHCTLITSDIPYINHWSSWLITIICPFFTLVGCNAIYWFYLKKGKIFGEGAMMIGNGVSDAAWSIDGEAGLIILGLLIGICLFPIIFWFAPSELLLGVLYHKKGLWEEIVHVWQNLTTKQSIFIITKVFFFAGTISFICWEIVAMTIQYLYKIGVFVFTGDNKIE